MLNLSVIVAGLAFLSYLVLLWLVLRRSAVESLRRAFVVFLLCMTGWSLGALLARLDPQHIRAWMTFAQVGNTLGLPMATFNFAQRFSGRERSRRWALLGVAGLLAAAAAMLWGTIGTARLTPEGLVEVSYRPAMLVLGAYWILFLGMSAWDLAVAYGQATNAVRRNRLRYPLMAIALIFLGALTNGIPALRRLPVDITANWLSAILLAYAILRYRLLDVELALRTGLSFASVALSIAATYIVSLVALRYAGGDWPLALLILATLSSYLLLRFVPGLQQSVQLRIDRLIFPQRYDAQALLAEVGQAGQRLRPISELATLALERLRTHLSIRYGTFLTPSPGDGKFRPIATVHDPPGVQGLALRPDHPLIFYLQESRHGLETQRIPEIPQLKGMWSNERQELEALRCAYFLPVLHGDELLGLFALGPKANERLYSLTEQRFLETLAGQLAVIMENAHLYDAAQSRLAELQQAYAELQELDRLKDEFIQNVSHELRTPLTFVKGYIEMLLDGVLGPPLPAEQAEALRIVQQRTEAVIRLVNDILSFQSAERERMRKEPVSLARVAEMAVRGAQAAADNYRITLHLDVAPGPHLVLGDEGRLGQVFDNLLSNAIKFSPNGGNIWVRMHSDDEWVIAEVEDQGIGIPADKLDKIWERFYQVDGSSTRRFGGTGLGLAIVKRIVEAHDGLVEVSSQVGVGSCFRVTLPALREEVNPAARPTAEERSPTSDKTA